MSIERYDYYHPQGVIIIGPISLALLVFSILAGYYIFLDPNAATYDLQIGVTLFASIVVVLLAVAMKTAQIQTRGEYNIKNTLLVALIAAAAVSVVSMLMFLEGETYSTITSSLVLYLALPAIFEECLRLGVFGMFQKLVGTNIAVILQAFLFAMWHTIARTDVDVTYLTVLFLGGIILMVAILISGNLLAGIIAHAIINLRPILFTLVFSPLMLIVIMLTVVIIFARRKI